MIRIDNIKVAIGDELTKKHIAKRAKVQESDILDYKVIKKAIDARKKEDVHYVYTVVAATKKKIHGFSEYIEKKYTFPKGDGLKNRPVIVGTGPCGLFAGLMLAKAGAKPILLERGADVDARHKAVEEFWTKGKLDTRTNVQFGEGGAGTFSDGKLNSGINDERCQFVLDTFARFGAPDEITYTAKPHIGTDILRNVVKNIRLEIESLGGEVRFLNKVVGVLTDNNSVCGVEVEKDGEKYEIKTDNVILAIGHSARDTYRMLEKLGIKMEQKNFSVGVRIEHSQEMINKSQYGDFWDKLGAADYKLSAHFENGRSAYTFCMCPGGEVVASASFDGGVVTNGMSNNARCGKNANSALLVNVNTSDFPTNEPLSGVDFQEEIEKKAFVLAGSDYRAPAQYVGDFLGVETDEKIEPTYRPGVKFCDIKDVFPSFVTDTLKLAIKEFDKKLKGFAHGGAVMTAPETRSSAPVRIVRDKESYMADIRGLYPAGEGAGYAGGIMSAAVDGIKVAEAVVKKGMAQI
ncbi:MAG: FAD-dependent oxidoreductase [Clostridia bacterium]|nr:FAD-dependent oxidoreductase [Clostridia bacterium]